MNEQVEAIGHVFVEGLRRILGRKLHACYLYGAAAFPDDVPTGDLDFHVILSEPLTDEEKLALYELHDALGRDYPPIGCDMDGYYLLLVDARGSNPPRSEMWDNATDTSWALHRAHIHGDRYITLHGPDPREVYRQPTWPEIEEALGSELQYVESHLQEYPHYCILQLCRLIYSHETGDVVISKAQAGDWANRAFPRWQRHVELARHAYAGEARDEEMTFMREEIGAFLDFARRRMARAKGHRKLQG